MTELPMPAHSTRLAAEIRVQYQCKLLYTPLEDVFIVDSAVSMRVLRLVLAFTHALQPPLEPVKTYRTWHHCTRRATGESSGWARLHSVA